MLRITLTSYQYSTSTWSLHTRREENRRLPLAECHRVLNYSIPHGAPSATLQRRVIFVIVIAVAFITFVDVASAMIPQPTVIRIRPAADTHVLVVIREQIGGRGKQRRWLPLSWKQGRRRHSALLLLLAAIAVDTRLVRFGVTAGAVVQSLLRRFQCQCHAIQLFYHVSQFLLQVVVLLGHRLGMPFPIVGAKAFGDHGWEGESVIGNDDVLAGIRVPECDFLTWDEGTCGDDVEGLILGIVNPSRAGRAEIDEIGDGCQEGMARVSVVVVLKVSDTSIIPLTIG
mmetsp:Transcript_12885/g.35587  ORF Transcript_12885/g.35587 Transcript_12885/m.35587 type:complete len:285 (-) Transcript_12885:230-1084(-)